MQPVEGLRRIACLVGPLGVLLPVRKLLLRRASFASRGNLFLNLRGTLCASLWYWCVHFGHIVRPFCPHGLAILARWCGHFGQMGTFGFRDGLAERPGLSVERHGTELVVVH